MDIDIYQQCPCHTDKKIKFCCGKEIVNDLNQVLAKNSSGQALAALDLLDRTISKTGPRDCLLTIQTHILIANGEIEKAKKSNELFLTNNPNHSTGLHHRALIQLAEENVGDAVGSLQDAMDAIKGNEIPISLANAFRMIGLGLLSEGHLVGARAHLQFALGLKGGNDEELQRMVYQTFRLSGTSLLLRQEFQLHPPANDVEWAGKFNNAMRALDRGQFRKGQLFLKKIDNNFPDQISVVRGIAILHMFLGNLEEIPASWRRYSRLADLPELEAVEAEALAQLYDADSTSEKIDIVRVSFELKGIDGPNEVALSSPRLAIVPATGEDPFEEGPPPKSSFYLLDRDKINSAQSLTLQNVPNISGELMLFGKQTDRPARLEWVAAKNSAFALDKQKLLELFDEFLVGEPRENVVAETSTLLDTMTWNWHLPDDVTREQHAELVDLKRLDTLENGWANLPFEVLDNKSPREVAQDPKYRIALQALLLHLEISPDAQFAGDENIDQLRKTLGINQLPKIDPSGQGNRKFSPVQQQFLMFEKLTDDQLFELQSEAMAIGNIKVLKHVVPEVLNRPELKQVPRDVSYSMLAQLTQDEDAALECLSQARIEAKKANRPVGIYWVQEFEFRISHGLTEKLQSLLQTIQMHHLKEPDVEYQLARVLEKYGLLRGGPHDMRQAPIPQEAATKSSAIWTPDSGSHSSQTAKAESGEPSKLWVPD